MVRENLHNYHFEKIFRKIISRHSATGAAKMVLESGKHTGQLKDEVTSPGGTTIRAIHTMERAGIRGIMMDAVQASAERATELGSK